QTATNAARTPTAAARSGGGTRRIDPNAASEPSRPRLKTTPTMPAPTPSTANTGSSQADGTTTGGRANIGCDPRTAVVTRYDARTAGRPVEIISRFGATRSSSSTKTAPAIGALKAAVSPAPAPAASSARRADVPRPPSTAEARAAPRCTVGPSRPSDSPDASA